MLDGSDAIADWPLLNALVNTASGATWVSIHHGGGVGMGRSIHAGQVTVADGTPLAAEKISRVLTNDPGMGVIRHVDAGYDRAVEVADERGVRVPMRERRRGRGGAAREQHARHQHRRARHVRLRRWATARPSACVHDAALVIEDGRVVVGRRGCGGTRRRRAASTSRAARSSPGFVDSHTHLVFAGDRSAEFAARMAGERYDGGGIATTVAATRAASDAELRASAARRIGRDAGASARPRWRRRAATGSTSRRRRGCCASAASSPPRPRSSAPTWCRRSTRAIAPPTSISSAARCSTPARRSRGGSTCSATSEPSTPTRRARSCAPAWPRGSCRGCTATSSRPGPARRSPREFGAASVDHCTHLTDDDVPRCRTPASSRRCCPPPSSRRARRTRTLAGCSTPASPSRSPPTATPEAATSPRCRS